ncbi:hypothetical protein HU200_004560 [Digitaria exilis]|uniref:F-box domain-containing protein n=1 Tax=Digitaria exilis TaxID=1010633 RepID=A0A835FSV5_9POAL|nr:hypothetical protein HU200_004560 [Digitaria exilis]
MDAELGEDVLTEILSRLPFRSLARFQCVSTSWRRIISSDYLRRKLPLITSGVLYHDGPRDGGGAAANPAYSYACAPQGVAAGDGVAVAGDMSFFPRHGESTIIDGCNGLLLYYASRPMEFHVVNPTTRRWATLPAPTGKRTLLSVLAFDPYASPHYKVVCFTGWLPRGATVEVFDSRRGAWRDHDVDFGLDTDAMTATMHYSGGALHVLAYSGHVVRVDLDTMACTVTALPAPVSCRARAGHCRGRLRFASSDGTRLRIWELRDGDAGDWALMHEIGVGDVVPGGESSQAMTFLFMAFHPERDVVYLWSPWKLLAFDLVERRVEEEWAFGSEKEGAHLIQVWLFPFSRHLAKALA